MKHFFFIFSCTIFCLSASLCIAQSHDTLPAVRVTAATSHAGIKTPVPLQVFNAADLAKRNIVSAADALKFFAGVQVKDYGGIGGLKTISVRSLGANHTAVAYDGIVLGDAQGGQTDLGKFSVHHIGSISLSNSGPTDLLAPARNFAAAALITITGFAGDAVKSAPALMASVDYGSFGYFSPALHLRTGNRKRTTASVSATYSAAKGNYPFSTYEKPDSFARRANSAITALQLETGLRHIARDSSFISLKAFFYTSDRGLPGAVIVYNTAVTNQRLQDENFFIQASRETKATARQRLRFQAKFSTDKIFYRDPAYPNSFGRLENNFHQKELYVSGAYKYAITPCISAAISSDIAHSELIRTDFLADGFASPRRNTFWENAALQYKRKSFELSGNMLYTVINEMIASGKAGRNLHEFAPAVAASVGIPHSPWMMRAFYKKIFRAPTFNDLYYTNVGNISLRPEYAHQYNIGSTFSGKTNGIFHLISFTADAFINTVKDKIIAVPRQNLFQWSMQNIGRVLIKGIDVTAHAGVRQIGHVQMSAEASYSFQEALDRTNRSSALYNDQIPYTPQHSGSIHADATRKNLSIGYNIMFSSYRYRAGDATPENLVQGWSTHDISLSYEWHMKDEWLCRFFIRANNIFDGQYEIIKFYPMPRFNFRAGTAVNIKKKKQIK